MGMLLRHRPKLDNLTTTESFGRPEKPKAETVVKPVVRESVKDEPPKTVKRGRPTKR